MWAIEMFATFIGWLKEPQKIDDRELQWIEMFVNFYVYLVEWVEYSMFSTEIRITIIPTLIFMSFCGRTKVGVYEVKGEHDLLTLENCIIGLCHVSYLKSC